MRSHVVVVVGKTKASRWPALCRFLTNGRHEIDNNIAERALRSIAVGRRN
jgi:hypothetical protein